MTSSGPGSCSTGEVAQEGQETKTLDLNMSHAQTLSKMKTDAQKKGLWDRIASNFRSAEVAEDPAEDEFHAGEDAETAQTSSSSSSADSESAQAGTDPVPTSSGQDLASRPKSVPKALGPEMVE